MSELLPCPFCGEKDELYPGYHGMGEGKPYQIDCLGCGIDFEPREGMDVIAAWNRRALAASTGAAPVVKALEWRKVHHGTMHTADSLLGEYRAWEIDEGYWWHVGMSGGTPVKGDIEAAKAAAQADYETRIRSALSAAPLPLGGEPVATVEPLTEFSYFECPECGAVATPTYEAPMAEGVEALREALAPLVHLSTREAKSVLDKFNAVLSRSKP